MTSEQSIDAERPQFLSHSNAERLGVCRRSRSIGMNQFATVGIADQRAQRHAVANQFGETGNPYLT